MNNFMPPNMRAKFLWKIYPTIIHTKLFNKIVINEFMKTLPTKKAPDSDDFTGEFQTNLIWTLSENREGIVVDSLYI